MVKSGTGIVGGAGFSAVNLGTELNSTPVAGANDTQIGATIRKYSFFTLPSAATFYMVTGVEWLNGTVINGNMFAGVEIVNANPPTLNPVCTVAWSPGGLAQSGASAVQRINVGAATLVPGGTILGGWVATNSATARIGTTTVSNANKQKNVSGTSALCDTTAWTATTEEAYVKVYYKAVF